ncbi:Aste57867_24949 [Aphanomyces stellatus]|uniref:tRNA-intron lyase n=1 Tax=Aphanomyces stellatus TaxID=120398 RepID=A0A485LRU8_9STRA|nr:hypothetical protein As57867_024871 [Aphanomyces stellatus]VFU01580.1 Aste57867_24949 [Aphanomyces stellatus]
MVVAVCLDGKVWSAADAKELREKHRIVCGSGGVCRESSNKAPVHRIPLQLTPEQVYVGHLHGFITKESSSPPATGDVMANVAVSSFLQGWWVSAWNTLASFFPSYVVLNRHWATPLHVDQLPSTAIMIPTLTTYPKDSIDNDNEANTLGTHVPLRHRVFRDLWEKGFHITSGSKFGGDFLLYDADPLTTHASAIVVVSESPMVPAADIAGFGRLARAVKKSWVLAYSNDRCTICYTTLVHVDTTSDRRPRRPNNIS